MLLRPEGALREAHGPERSAGAASLSRSEGLAKREPSRAVASTAYQLDAIAPSCGVFGWRHLNAEQLA